jgi:adenylate cyclase
MALMLGSRDEAIDQDWVKGERLMGPEMRESANGQSAGRLRRGSDGSDGPETLRVTGPTAGDSLALPATPVLRGDTALDGEVREVSILMADLRGFTAFCERVAPRRMSRLLNEYLTAMVEVILRHKGRVQDFIGDGILGVFGAPGQDPDHAWHAALSALEMQATIRELAGRWEREEEALFTLGVAVHTGEVFAGAVGSPKRQKYAVVGDPVNTVARLEELNRNLGTEIVMSGDALALVRNRVDVHPRGAFSLRGRSRTVEVFELLGASRGYRAGAASASHLRPS